MSVVFEQNLSGFPNSTSNPGIQIGQTVKGSLTSRTNTRDDYNLIVDAPTLINVKFSVDQQVNVNDYYELRTPIGTFSVRPNYTQIPESGITFLVSPNESNRGLNWNDQFSVVGSSNGVFREGYTLEVKSHPGFVIGKVLSPSRHSSWSSDSDRISPNDMIRGWDGSYDVKRVEFFIPSVGNDEPVTVVLRNLGVVNYGTSNQPRSLSVVLYNEGLRNLNTNLISDASGVIIPNLQSGRGYFLDFDVRSASTSTDYTQRLVDSHSVNSFPHSFTFGLEFWTQYEASRKKTLNSPSNDHFNGYSQSIDTVVYTGTSSNYNIARFSPTSDIWTISSKTSSERDTATVDRLQFTDKTIALDVGETAGKAYRIYKAAFNREPDHVGLGYWIAEMDKGMNMVNVAARFIDSPEFRAMYGTNPTYEQYLTKVYQNVLGRDPEAAGYNWWLNEMRTNPDKTRAKVLADFSESEENIEGTAALIVGGIQFDPWIGMMHSA